MARPKKDANCIEARQRIIDGFWTLLEERRLSDITIGMVVEQAQCNRGTFYYHFESLDALLHEAIERELLVERDIPGMIFELACGIEDSPSQRLGEANELYRLSLIMDRGGLDLVAEEAKRTIVGMWTALLVPGQAELPEPTREVIEYFTSGTLGLISYRFAREKEGRPASSTIATDDFLKRNAAFVIEQVARYQGMTEADVLARLHMASCLMHQARA